MNNKVSSLITRVTALAFLASPLCSVQLHSQEVYSQIVGAIAIDVPAESDMVVAFPFKQSASFKGGVASASGTTVSFDDGALTAGEFDGGDYFLYVESGPLEGRRFDIVSNTASAVTLDEAPTGLVADDTASIRKHWTLGEAFPQGIGFIDEEEPGLRQVELIVPTQVSLGTGIATERVFYFHDDAWREVGKPLSATAGDVAFEPGTAFVIRNNGSDDLETYVFGEVVQSPLAIPVFTSAAEPVDNFVAFERPLATTLDELSGLADVMGTADRLVVFGRDGKFGPDKSIVEYRHESGQWFQGDTPAGDHVIEPGEGIAIRKAAGAEGENFWVNEWSLPTTNE